MRLKFSLKFFLIFIAAISVWIALHCRVENSVAKFKSEFASKDFQYHEFSGPGELQWVHKAHYTNETSLMDYFTFQRKYVVKYDACLWDGNGQFTEYHCETHFLISGSKTNKTSHEQDWYASWT